MKGVCIYPKEAAKLLRIGERQAQRLFRNIRFALNKKRHQYITVKEFCAYTGIDEESLKDKL
jgi:hypothetical protein